MPHVAFYLQYQQKSSLTIHATLLYTSPNLTKGALSDDYHCTR